MKCLLLAPCVLLLSLVPLRALAGPILVEKGRPRAVILLGAEASKAARIAAEELTGYIRKMSGARLPVIVEGQAEIPAGETVILLGDSQRAREVGFDPATLKPEELRLKTGADWVLIAGSDRGPTGFPLNGTRWAAYELLERLGVRWLWPGKLGEVVPRRETVALPDLDYSYTPLLIQRNIRNIQWNERVQRGLDKLGFTRRQFEAVHRDGHLWFARQRLATQGKFSYGHAFGHWWERYHEDHPDWFALQPDGTRNQPNIGNRSRLCVSNPEVIAQAAREAGQRLAANPSLFCASISPNDGGRATFCLCEKCRAWDAPGATLVHVWHPTNRDFMIPSLTDRYVRFYSEVAKLVVKEHPHRYLGAYAYSAYRLPPVREKLHPNVFIGFVGLSYLSEEARRRDLQSWDAWTKAAQKFFLRPNLLAGGMGFPALFPHRLVEDLKHCADTGMRVTDFDCCYQHWALKGLNYYVLARFLWNPEINVDEVIADYCRSGFGPAAEPVQQYFAALEGLIDQVAQEGKYEGRRKSEPLAQKYTDEFLRARQAELDHARKLAGNDRQVLDRIAFLEVGLNYTRLNRDRVLARAALRAGTGTREAYEQADRALTEFYQQIGITWALNSGYLRFYGF